MVKYKLLISNILVINRAISSGDVKKFRALLKEGVDINEQDSNGWTPLHCATAAEANFDVCV